MEETADDEEMILFPNKLAREKKYWQFIRMIADPSVTKPLSGFTFQHCVGLYCTKCKLKLKYVKGDTKIIRRHMECIHAKDLKTFVSGGSEKRLMNDFLLCSNKKMKRAGKSEEEELKRLCVSWITRSLRPIHIVEDGGLIQLVRYVNSLKSEVVLPRRTCISDSIRRVASDGRSRIKEKLQAECDYYCASTDIWTSRSTKSFIAFTVHFLTKNFDMVSLNLEVKAFGGKHSGERIAQMLSDIIMDWGLEKNRITFMLRDNAANGSAACNMMGVPSFGCIPHSMHLVLAPLLFPKKNIRDVISGCGDFDTLLTSENMSEFDASLTGGDKEIIQTLSSKIKGFRDLCKYFAKSPKGLEKLVSFRPKEARPVKPIVDVVTRWSSTCDMLKRLMVLRGSIESFVSYAYSNAGRNEFGDFRKKKPKAEDWFIVECILKLLYPFEAATTLLSGETYGTMVLAFPTLRIIKRNISNDQIFDDVVQNYESSGEDVSKELVFMKQVREYILNHFCARFTNIPVSVIACSVLHPSFAAMKHLRPEEKRGAEHFIINEMMDMAATRTASPLPDKSDVIDLASSPTNNGSELIFEMMGTACDDDVCGSLDETRDKVTLRLNCVKELQSYLEIAKRTTSKMQCPKGWWKANHGPFKLLSPVARKWLGCLCSSVPSERAFSTSGNTITVKRSSLSDSMVRDIVFLHDNCKGLDL